MTTPIEEYARGIAGNFLSAAKVKSDNLQNTPLTIKAVEWTEIGDTNKPVLSFSETDKSLVLNKGNAAILMDAFTADEKAWVGKKVQLVITKKQYQGQMVDGITVIALA